MLDLKLTPEQIERLSRLKNDFPFYAKNCLIIRPKNGEPTSLELNRVQHYIHEKLEKQKKEKGYVRALILKGRQQGCSTLVAARFYHQVTQRKGCKAFILAHREDATNNLYNLAKRYNDNCPPLIKPSIGVSNAKSLYFDKLDSGYSIGTAGGGTVGRSDTIQLLHASEAAFYENTSELSSGIFQTVADAPGTEIIIESTANGQGNMFHKMCMSALAGESEYQLIFVPWFWSPEYSLVVPDGFTLSDEELNYKENYGLTDGQIMWRRNKISNFSGDVFQFKKEYPATVMEAFEASGENTFINVEAVGNARKRKEVEKAQNLIIGVDPAGMGHDKTAISWRYGRVVSKTIYYSKLSPMQIVGLLAEIIYRDKPSRMFIDAGNMGASIVDRLHEISYSYQSIVWPVNSASKPDNQERFLNKRAEMWNRMREQVEGALPYQLPDDDLVAADLTIPKKIYHSSGKIQLESKQDIFKRLGRSPDGGDSIALTYAYVVPVYEDTEYLQEMYESENRKYDQTRNSVTGY